MSPTTTFFHVFLSSLEVQAESGHSQQFLLTWNCVKSFLGLAFLYEVGVARNGDMGTSRLTSFSRATQLLFMVNHFLLNPDMWGGIGLIAAPFV